MVPQLNYYDIRHPFISIFYFPIWAIIETCLNNIISVTSLATVIKAVIPMFVFGVDFIVEKLKLNSKFVYLFLYIIIDFINISTLLDIYKFLI